MSNQALFFITIVGALTAFFAASVAIVQNDLKKVIAYSTTSQLGYGQLEKIPVTKLFNLFHQLRWYSSSNKIGTLVDILPLKEEYIEKYSNLTYSDKYTIKSKYKNQSIIYLWINMINGRSYVGRTVNISSRLDKYFNRHFVSKFTWT